MNSMALLSASLHPRIRVYRNINPKLKAQIQDVLNLPPDPYKGIPRTQSFKSDNREWSTLNASRLWCDHIHVAKEKSKSNEQRKRKRKADGN